MLHACVGWVDECRIDWMGRHLVVGMFAYLQKADPISFGTESEFNKQLP